MNGNEIKMPKLDGNDAEVRQEIRVFARQVIDCIEYLSVLLERLTEAARKE